MKSFRLRFGVTSLVALAITAGHLFVPDPAEAAGGAMFRVFRSWHGNLDGTDIGETYSDPWYMAYSEPRDSTFTGMDTAGGFWTHDPYPPATAVFTPEGGFEFPRQVIHFGTQPPYDNYTMDCARASPPYCADGYPQSIYYYSYYNYKGFFYPNNPNAPSAPVTIRRTVTSPDFTTMQFNNNYAFARVGSIKITPGPNKFGGTMRYFWGPNARWYWFLTNNYPCCSKGYAHNYRTGKGPYGSPTGMLDSTEYSPQIVGGTHARWEGTIFHTYLTTGDGTPNDPGAYITRMEQYINTSAPWTTGRVSVYQGGGVYLDSGVQTGSDNRNASGTLGTMSLVVPWLAHQYLTSFNPVEPVESTWHEGAIVKMRITFLPEPRGFLLLGAGILGLVGVYRLRRR